MAGVIEALPAQPRLDARQKLVQRKRFGDVVVGAQLERQDLVDLLILGREHDDRHGAELANLLARFDAVEHGQHDVEHDEVRLLALRHRDRAAPVARRDDRVAAALQVEAQRLQDRRLVVDDENLLIEVGAFDQGDPRRLQPPAIRSYAFTIAL